MGAKRIRDRNLPTGIYRVRGRLQIQWMNLHGKRERELLPRGTTLEEAEDRREDKLRDVVKGLVTPNTSSRVTVLGLLEGRETALTAMHKKDRDFPSLKDWFGKRKALTVTYSVIQEYVRDRQADGAADATIHNELAALKNAFRRGRKAGLIPTVPDFPMPSVNNVWSCFFTIEECDALYKLLPPKIAAAAEFSALTGLRAGNVFGLTWDNVDLGRGEMRFPGTVMKNGKPLVVPFAHGGRIEALLRSAHRWTKGQGRVFGKRDYRAAWERAVGPKGLDKWGEVADTREPSGVRRVRPRWHDLRHSFAQMMIDAGADEATIMALGGWKTRSAFSRYTMDTDAAKRAALALRDKHVEAERAKPKVIDLMTQRRVAGGGR